jgi:hypothetical protein
MVGVRFTKPYPPYNVGDVAGFPPAVADTLVGRRIAERANLPKPFVTKHVEGEDNIRYGGLDALGDAAGQV